jgi:putative transcriptional regulator
MRKVLKEKRLKLERTQQRVADDLGISTEYIRKIESGHFNPGRDLMIKIERYYNTPAEELFPDLFF